MNILKPALWVILLSVISGTAHSQWKQTTDMSAASAFLVNGSDVFVGASGLGIKRSVDNGAIWAPSAVGIPNFAFVTALGVSATTLFAGVELHGTYRSIDNGLNWSVANVGIANRTIVTFAALGNQLFAGANGGAAIYVSNDNGASWSASNSGLGDTSVSKITVVGGTLFAGTYSKGIYRSMDQGKTWLAVNTGLPVGYVSTVIASGANLFTAGGFGVYRSVDNGSNWTAANSGLSSVDALIVRGPNLFTASFGGGVFVTTDNGGSWTDVSTGLSNKYISSLVVSGTYLLAGTTTGVERRPLSEMVKDDGVAELSSPSDHIAVYPNPSSQSVNLSFTSEEGFAEVRIINLLGESVSDVFKGSLHAGAHSFHCALNGVAPGMYECIIIQKGHYQRAPVVRLQ